jgi:hypothetical protein
MKTPPKMRRRECCMSFSRSRKGGRSADGVLITPKLFKRIGSLAFRDTARSAVDAPKTLHLLLVPARRRPHRPSKSRFSKILTNRPQMPPVASMQPPRPHSTAPPNFLNTLHQSNRKQGLSAFQKQVSTLAWGCAYRIWPSFSSLENGRNTGPQTQPQAEAEARPQSQA